MGGRLRFALGMGQMFAAVTALVLLLSTGLSRVTLIATAAATSLTLISRLLFHRRT